MVALAEHLRSDQRLRLTGAETVEDAHEGALAARGVAIEHIDGHGGKVAAETLLDFLGAEADRLQDFAAAHRTFRRNRSPRSTVVADEKACAAMHGHRDAAFATAEV